MAALDRFGIEYPIVGDIAVGSHAEPRFTKYLDGLIHIEKNDVGRLVDALKEFGAPLHLVKAEDFLRQDFVFLR